MPERDKESGQVLVEYILILAVCISAILMISRGFKTSVGAVWTSLAKEISAACPKGCAPDPKIRRF